MNDIEPLSIYTDWYKNLNVEKMEDICSLKFTKSTITPMEIISWDKNFIYFVNPAGLLYRGTFDKFIDCLNFYRGWESGSAKITYPPYFREEILKVSPPVKPKDAENHLFAQEHGLILYGLKIFLDKIKEVKF